MVGDKKEIGKKEIKIYPFYPQKEKEINKKYPYIKEFFRYPQKAQYY